MRTGNPGDGMFFFLFIIPFLLSIWSGDLLRKKILSHLVLENYWSQSLSGFIGILAEILIILAGILAGILLIKLV
jgi:hypothetical protein